MKLKRFAILFAMVSVFATLFASVSCFAAEEATLGSIFSYTGLVDFVVGKLYSYINAFMMLLGFSHISASILLPAFAALVLVVGVVFMVFGFSTWKVMLRVLYFALAFLVGYILGVCIVGIFDLHEVPFMPFLPHAIGTVLGILGCFFSSICLRFTIFMTPVALSITLLPAILQALLGNEFIFSHVLFTLAYVAVGSLIGYVIAFPLMRPAMSFFAAATAGFCITFGAFVLFAENLFATYKLDVNLFFWIITGSLAAIALIVEIIVYFVRKKRAQKKALALAA